LRERWSEGSYGINDRCSQGKVPGKWSLAGGTETELREVTFLEIFERLGIELALVTRDLTYRYLCVVSLEA